MQNSVVLDYVRYIETSMANLHLRRKEMEDVNSFCYPDKALLHTRVKQLH